MLKEKLFLNICLVFLVAVFNSHNTSAQLINDPLLGSTVGTQVGGSFTSEGYKPGLGQNHILYVVPSQVVNGYVEFEMKGFWPNDLVGENNDHGFIIMYDARGIGNTPTWEEFRDNYFRWNFHWRQNASVFKCVVNCAAPTSFRLNSTYAVFLDGRDWYDEPNGSGFTWDSNKAQWYKVKIEWNNKTFKVFVDGNLVWVNHDPGPYDYAPIDHRIWLGSGVDKYNSDVSDVVYRNFKLFSYAPQNPTYQVTLANDVLVSSNVYEFDIYLQRQGGTPFELSACQIGLTFLDNIRNGGTLSAMIIPGTSQFSNSAQTPENPIVSSLSGTKRVFQLESKTPPGAGAGSIISAVSPGTRVGRFRITNTTNFAGIQANLAWTFSDTEYRTKISAYVGGSNVDITNQSSHLNNLVNPFLPVELSSFQATTKHRSVNIVWTTETEINTSVFQIERASNSSLSAQIWEIVGEVTASGNSNSRKEYRYTDEKLNSGKVCYRLKMIDYDGTFKYSEVIEVEIAVPKDYAISQNYPNPFNPTSRIDYQLPFDSKVILELYGINGEKTATLIDDYFAAGYYSTDINAHALNLTSGVYIYRMSAQNSSEKNFVQVKKLMFMK